MAEYSGFFNAELDSNNQYDRTYAAEQFAQYFSAFIGNGVYITPSTQLKVVPVGNELAIYVSIGKAYINGYFYSNDDNLYKKLSNPNGANPRIDRIVLRLDLKTRKIYIDVLEGVASSSPVAKGIIRNQYIYELALADVYVGATALTIVDADITDLRMNSLLCGYVHGVIDQIDTTSLFNQFQASFNTLYNNANSKFSSLESKVTNDFYTLHNQQDSTFKSWFENIKSQLSGDVAANLQRQIDENRERLSFDSIDTAVDGSSFTNGEDGRMLVNDWTRNLLHCTLGTTTQNGVTCTANGDGTYTLNGESTGDTWISFSGGLAHYEPGKYKFIASKNDSDTYISGTITSSKGETRYVFTGDVFTIKQGDRCNFGLSTGSLIFDNVLLKPMLTTDLNATYDNFVPYNKKITNLFNPILGTTTKNGITCTNNGDGTYTLSGTSSAETIFQLGTLNEFLQEGVQYKFVGCPSGGSTKTYFVDVWYASCDVGNGTIFGKHPTKTMWAEIHVASNLTLSNVVFKPMITEILDATYNDFVRYGVSHRNLLVNTLQTTTQNGVTTTNNGDGTYTLNGTSTGIPGFLIGNIQLKKGITYKLVGCPQGGSDSTFEMNFVDSNGTSVFRDYGSGVEVTPDKDISYDVKCSVRNGYTCNNVLFKPMVTTNLNATYNDFVKGQEPTTIKSCGKNLVKHYTAVETAAIYNVTLYIAADLQSDTDYAISLIGANGNIAYLNENLFIQKNITFNGTRQSIVAHTKSNVEELKRTEYNEGHGWAIFKNYNENKVTAKFTDVQIELGTEATSYEPYTGECIDVYDETEIPAFGLRSHKGVTNIISNANIKATYPTSEGGVSFMETLYNHKDVSDNIREGLFAELQTNISVLQTQIDTNKSQISANKTQIDANKSTLDTHQLAINNQQEIISNHTNQLNAMSGGISTMNGQVNDLTSSLETTERNVSTLTTKCSSLEITQTDTSTQLDRIKGVMNYNAISSYLAKLDNLIYVPGVWVNGSLFDVHFSGAFLSRFVGSSGGYRYVMLGITLYNGSQVTLPSGAANKIKICSLGGFIGDAHIDTSGGTVLPSLTWGDIFIQLTCSKDSGKQDALYMYGNVPDTQTIPAGTTIVLPVITVQTEPLSAS